MALVFHVLGDCPGCSRKDYFGNVEIFRGKYVYRGCKSCDYSERKPLPQLRKKILYLDQFFFSHAFRGEEKRFLEAAARIKRVTSLQLLVVPYSSIHEDETYQWSRRDELFKFIKAISRGHSFMSAFEVDLVQLLKAFRAWLAQAAVEYELAESDVFRNDVHSWDSYFRIEVGRYSGDIDLIRKLKGQSVEGLVGLFDKWRTETTTFERDIEDEYHSSGKSYIDFYLDYIARIAAGDHEAMLNAPVASTVVETMLQVVPADVPSDQSLNLCAMFLLQSEHFKDTPHQKLSAHIFGTLKDMVKAGAYANKERALKRLAGFFYDVSHISTYAPYCDAFVMDQPMAELVTKPTVALEQTYGTKVFSLNNWDDLLAWLDGLVEGMTEEHKAGLALAYPSR